MKINVLLSCKHSQTFDSPAPVMGEETYCRRCGDWKLVEVAPSPWSLKCLQCSFGRQYGADGRAAGRAVRGHLEKRPWHVVEMRQGLILRQTVRVSQHKIPSLCVDAGVTESDDQRPEQGTLNVT